MGNGTFYTNYPYGTNTPQRVGTATNWQAIAAGVWHTVALRTDGTLWAWGINGALSVVGATLAIFIAMNWGFAVTLVAASGTYLIGLIALLAAI